MEFTSEEIVLIYNATKARKELYEKRIKEISEQIEGVESGRMICMERDKWLTSAKKQLAFYQENYSAYVKLLTKLKPEYDNA